jgi:hypothetical protein
MRLYPDVPRRRARTLAGDAAVLLLVLVFAWLGLKVHDAVAELAALGRGLENAGGAVTGTAHDAAGAVRSGFGSAADAVGGAPVIGGTVAGALRSAGDSASAPVEQTGASSGRKLVAAGRDGEARAYALADLLGWLTFGLPTLILLLRWGPPRVGRAREWSAAHRVIAAFPLDPARERELARRAAYGLSYEQLARYTPDPIGDLLDGRHDALLAALGDDAGIAVGARTL